MMSSRFLLSSPIGSKMALDETGTNSGNQLSLGAGFSVPTLFGTPVIAYTELAWLTDTSPLEQGVGCDVGLGQSLPWSLAW